MLLSPPWHECGLLGMISAKQGLLLFVKVFDQRLLTFPMSSLHDDCSAGLTCEGNFTGVVFASCSVCG